MIDIRKIKSADILLFHTKGFSPFSAITRFFTKSYWNHIGLLVCEDDTFYVIEATSKGMKKNLLSDYTGKKYYDLKVVRVKEEAYKDIGEYEEAIVSAIVKSYGLIGVKYDWFAIVFLGIRFVVRGCLNLIPLVNRIPIINTNLLENRSKFFCSESICYYFYKSSSIIKNIFAGKKHPNQKCNTTTPGDVNKSVHVEYITGKNRN